MLNKEKLRGNATHLFSPLSDPDSPGHFLMLQQPWLQARWRAWQDSGSSSCRAKLVDVARARIEEENQEKRKEAGRVQVSEVERQESKHGVLEGSTKRVRVLDKASAERINAEVADRRESTWMAEDGGRSGVARKVEFSDAKHEIVVYPHFHEFGRMLCSVSLESARVPPHRSSEARASLNSKGRSQHVAKSVS